MAASGCVLIKEEPHGTTPYDLPGNRGNTGGKLGREPVYASPHIKEESQDQSLSSSPGYHGSTEELITGAEVATDVPRIKKEPRDSCSTLSCSSSNTQLIHSPALSLNRDVPDCTNNDLADVESEPDGTAFREQGQVQEGQSADSLPRRTAHEPKCLEPAQAMPHKHELISSSCLKIHVPTHTRQKPYKCSVCPAEFSCPANLNRHFRTHTGKKPYECKLCPAEFYRSEDLRRHLLTHSGEKPYKCHLCPAEFNQSSHLKRHLQVHTRVKPYKCQHCPAEFTQSANLKRHIQSHTGEKPYRCQLCPAQFVYLGNLKCHLRTHTGEKPYRCVHCPAAFAKSTSLKSHVLMHTGKKKRKPPPARSLSHQV